jgi:kelch-like protein 20
MTKRRCGVGVAVLNDQLYAVGGHDGQCYLNSIERYDPHTNQWYAVLKKLLRHLCRTGEVAPTTTCRTSVGVAVLDGMLYAVGGQDGVSCLNVVERFDPQANRWTKVAPMGTRRLGVAVAVVGVSRRALNVAYYYRDACTRWAAVTETRHWPLSNDMMRARTNGIK